MYFGSSKWDSLETLLVVIFMFVGFFATIGAIGFGLWWLWSHLAWIA